MPTVTGTATFTNATNNINLADLGGIGIEPGDVIQVADSTLNDQLYTVEVITDADNVIVNQAHAGGTTTKSLIDESATAGVTISLLTKWYNAQDGLGQAPVDVFGDRLAATLYYGPPNRSMQVTMTTSTGTNRVLKTEVDGLPSGFADGNNTTNDGWSVNFTVPAGLPYERVAQSGCNAWVETR